MDALHEHIESHRSQRAGWLRAAVLGANDGLISTGSLVLGMATAQAAPGAILLSGVAGLAAGAFSMAAGEYVSVSSQSDAEAADARREADALRDHPETELAELAEIYERRGLESSLAREVAVQLTRHDSLATHLRDELGIQDHLRARPVQAALASAAAFTAGALPPVLLAWLWPGPGLAAGIVACTLVLLAVLGYIAERIAGGGGVKGALRVLFWGALAQGATALIGHLFGVATA
ncbi:VIT1/CCC1 transporter family protein [Thermomonas mangrovi]|uniref:VIT1/CCC1 transporter family protein n=1 Tax=Thermomonas mangrovi TaxID=2993316 RepID=UPI0023076074|nr:VIT family protein [Thermomonas mangrovi]